MDSTLRIIILLFGILACVNADDYYVVAPKFLRLNSNETIGVGMDGRRGGNVLIVIQDHPGKVKKILETQVTVNPGKPELLKILLEPQDFPRDFLNAPNFPKLVSLSAHFPNFFKEILVPIHIESGYVFIQSDKPIYTPDERVSIRVISLNEDSVPSHGTLQLQIKNPNNSIVEQKIFSAERRDPSEAFLIYVYRFPTYPVLGEWSATVNYGYNFEQNSTVRFELQEYVLPTFEVELETPDIILHLDKTIKIKVSARYFYGRKVKGFVSFQLGVKKTTGETTFFAVIPPKQLEEGSYKLEFDTDVIKNHKDINWFPEIEKSRLYVKATVVEAATGKEEEVVVVKSYFTQTPLVISFKRCLRNFKPGLTSVIEADISYASGEPAGGVWTTINAVADNTKRMNIVNDRAKSDEDGRIAFEIQPEITYRTIDVTLEIQDPKYALYEINEKIQQTASITTSNSYIALARNRPERLKPTDTFGRSIDFQPPGIRNIYFLVMARGRILIWDKLLEGQYLNHRLEFVITYEMVPSFRLFVFAQHGGQLLADSLKIDVENVCHPDAKVFIEPEFSTKEPGNNGRIIIRGAEGTSVGLLAVDEAVYSLSKKDLLTNKKIFKRLESHDLGCGPGGGLTINSVLGNAGITIGTNAFSPSHSYSCVERRRRRREVGAVIDTVNAYEGFEKQCCNLGVERAFQRRSCYHGELIVKNYLSEEENLNCSKVFVECCEIAVRNELAFFKTTDILEPTGFGKSKGEEDTELIFMDDEIIDTFESKVHLRKDFKQSWIFQDLKIGIDKKNEIAATLPDSITTWVIQAVSVSSKHGICVAEPQKLEVFKKIFLQLNLPYSVVRNEQIEIQATVFNYGEKNLQAIVYMYGAKDLCSAAEPGKRSEKKNLTVDGKSAETVSFPVVPLKAEIIPIKVVVLTPEGSDRIQRELHVVPEGITKEIDIPIRLDPTNLQKRRRRDITSPVVTERYDPSQNVQVTIVKICTPEDYVPGTASCSIRAVGDIYGSAVETTIKNPEALFIEPSGCGEQNMVKFAPTLYTVRYLKVTGKLTAEAEEKGYQFIRQGYANQLNYRKGDGSYAAFKDRPTSTWLTAFVMKVFCQASDLIYIDENVLCSGIRWLINHQQPDGSYVENYPLYAVSLMGGLEGRSPMTAFVLIALEECKCDEVDLRMAKARAVSYLEDHLGDVNRPLAAAIVAYALSLSNSALKEAANDKLLKMAEYIEDSNWLYWTEENSAQSIQTAGYALLTQLLLDDMENSTAIVNWLNTKRLQSGSFASTQDTMIALQAMSEYAIRAQMPSVNLVTDITSSNDVHFKKTLEFNEKNALVLQDVNVNKVGGNLLIKTTGHGMGSLSVKLRYNVIVPPEDICKFDIKVNITDKWHEDLVRGLTDELRENGNRGSKSKDNKLRYEINICVRYLGDRDAEMSIVDVGIFSGFVLVTEDLRRIEEDESQLIQKYEKTNRGVVFYLEKVPNSYDYCFSFHVIREFIVGNTQMSIIKVYDYYNPDATCTKFYKPESNSPIVRTICRDGICECLEGGCPPKTPFSDIRSMKSGLRTEMLLQTFCEDYDYVWKGSLNREVRKDGSFLNISFTIREVIKAGIESEQDIEEDTRILLSRDDCSTANMSQNVMYLIMGKDGEMHLNENGQLWYRYLLDQASVIYSEQTESDQRFQRDVNRAAKKLKTEGCEG